MVVAVYLVSLKKEHLFDTINKEYMIGGVNT
jgi:hypothetical protein